MKMMLLSLAMLSGLLTSCGRETYYGEPTMEVENVPSKNTGVSDMETEDLPRKKDPKRKN